MVFLELLPLTRICSINQLKQVSYSVLSFFAISRNMLGLSGDLNITMKLIAIDEAHCVSEWGDDFRKEYQQLFELRSFFKVPVMALTATSTKKVKVDIMEHLQLMEDNTDVIFKSPDKPNIFLEIAKKESTEYETCLSWLIEHIRVKGSNSKKTIIYCR
jgi:ATP-dependent DNA helicase RecQ